MTLTPGLMLLLAVFAFSSGGAIHLQTPLLPALQREFAVDAAAIGWIPALSFGGFFAGIVFVAPLGDRYDKRVLLLGQGFGLVAALLLMAAAPSFAVLAAAAFLVGVCTSVTQHIAPIVVEFAPPSSRGKAVGTVLSGLFLGILSARVGSGIAGATLGWRTTYLIAAAVPALLVLFAVARLPRVPPRTRLSYGALMGSVASLYRSRADLRQASAIQFLLGNCYGAFWATVAPMLAALHGFGPAAAGLVGIPGAAGILVARPAGKWMDRAGAVPVVTTGICLVLAAYLAFGLGGIAVAAVFGGAVLLDCGLRSAMVANQALVTGADAETRSRANTVFGAHVWGGNATGALVASAAWTAFGWLGVCAFGCAASSAALVLYRLAFRR